MPTPAHPDPRCGTIVVEGHDPRCLEAIRRPDVQAVIHVPRSRPGWLDALARAVGTGAFAVARTLLDDIDVDGLAAWLHRELPRDVVAPEVRDALIDDVLALVERQHELSGASRSMVRILTGTPSRHCGFHLDTVVPGAAPCGLLRVYNGEGTDYVLPRDVVGMRAFYRWLGRREGLVRRLEAADPAEREGLRAEILALDERREFLRPGHEIHTAPSGSTVAFKHLDVRLHWSDHAPELAWIHCSPMAGEPRLLVNVTARPAERSGARARGANARRS